MNDVTNALHGDADVPNAEPSPERRMLHVMRAYNDSLLDQGDEGRANSRAMQAALDAHQSMAGELVAEVVEWEEDDGTTKHVVSFLCPLAEIPVGAKLYAAPPSAEPAQPVEAVGEAMLRAGTDAAMEWHQGVPQELRATDRVREQWAWLVEKILTAALAHPRSTGAFDFAAHLHRQRDWSGKTFGPGSRAQGVVDHIRKELKEIEADPADLKEWIDVVILALDGAWRSGAQPQEIIDALVAKQTKNEGRVWPDWRTSDPNKAIEHDRSHDAPTVEQAGKVVNHHGTTDIQTFARAYKAEVPCAELTVHGISAGLAALEDSGYAQRRTVGVPDGWKLVPVKAMREITEAGRKSLIESSKANVTYDTTAAYAYEEMVAAAPAPGKGGEA